MAAADSAADSLRSRLRHREAVADLGRRALESPEPVVTANGCSNGDAEIVPLTDAERPRRLGVAIGDLTEPRGVLADFEVRLDETDAEIDADSLPRIDGDPGQFRQLFQNLLDNASSYSGDGTPRISVFAEKDRARWMVSVRDRGIGIEPGDTDRILQVFERLHSHEKYDGAGIGLALCQRIVERRDGEITVDSESGEGTTFSVALPVVPETDAESATTFETDADANGRTDE